jgi:hypothetical protein
LHATKTRFAVALFQVCIDKVKRECTLSFI